MYPYGEIYCVTTDEDDVQIYEDLHIKWCFINYLAEQLPLGKKSFDYIICEDCLEQAANPQDIATGLGLYLKDTGYFLMSFKNIRYWRVMQNLMEGHFYHLCSRIFTRNEMINLMSASFFKDVNLLPEWGSKPPEKLLAGLELAGFEDIEDDLSVEKWLLQAAKSMPEIMELKRMYTPEIRGDLARLLRRLEYGVRVEESRGELWQLCQSQMIFQLIWQASLRRLWFISMICYGSYPLGKRSYSRISGRSCWRNYIGFTLMSRSCPLPCWARRMIMAS